MGPKRRARIYTPFLPFPFTEGAFFVIHDQARVLASMGWEVELVTWKESPGEITRKLRAPSRDRFCSDLLITSLREDRLERLTAEEWLDRVPETSSRPPGESDLRRAARVARSILSSRGSPELFHYPPSLDRRDRLPPVDVGVYHYSFAWSWLASGGASNEARRFVHLHNLESELTRIRIGGSGLPDAARSWLHRLNVRKLEAHERALPRHVDEMWFLSAVDMRRYASESPNGRLRLVPPTMNPELRDRRQGTFRSRRDSVVTVIAGFLGGGWFEPNRASMEWIVDRLAPELSRRGFGGRIIMAGRAIPDAIRRRAREYDFFQWPGFLPELETFWSSLSFFLIPHVKGSGVRIKLLEALVSGVPVLANQAAVEPLTTDLRGHTALLVSDDPRRWAERIMQEKVPFRTRDALKSPDVEDGVLGGSEIYDFLLTRQDERIETCPD